MENAPHHCGAFCCIGCATAYFRIELKNSSLDLVFFILSSRNSIAATIFYHPTQNFFEDFDLPRQSRTLCL